MRQDGPEDGTYLYCIVDHGKLANLGNIGLDNAPVRVVPFRDLAAVVHRCRADPYKTDDFEEAKRWILAHQHVVELATARFGTVIPTAFDTIFRGGEPEVEGWLEDEYEALTALLRRFRGKAEYGVKVYVDERSLDETLDGNAQLSTLRNSLRDKSKGVAYLLRKGLERRESAQRQAETKTLSDKILDEVADLVDEVKIDEKNLDSSEEHKGKVMLLNFYCLVGDEKIDALGTYLGKLDGTNDITVRFTGPWPPYSFVSSIRKGR
jgi:hypothetical protein